MPANVDAQELNLKYDLATRELNPGPFAPAAECMTTDHQGTDIYIYIYIYIFIYIYIYIYLYGKRYYIYIYILITVGHLLAEEIMDSSMKFNLNFELFYTFKLTSWKICLAYIYIYIYI